MHGTMNIKNKLMCDGLPLACLLFTVIMSAFPSVWLCHL